MFRVATIAQPVSQVHCCTCKFGQHMQKRPQWRCWTSAQDPGPRLDKSNRRRRGDFPPANTLRMPEAPASSDGRPIVVRMDGFLRPNP